MPRTVHLVKSTETKVFANDENYSMALADLTSKISSKILDDHSVTITIEIANVATLNDGDEFVQDKSSMVLSIVNIEEDKTLRNQSLYKEVVGNASTVERYKKPAQNLNISILFTSYNKDQSFYSSGLEKLEYIIAYLQSNNVFYYDDSSFFEQDEIDEDTAKTLNKLVLDLVSLKPDQLNQMWSYLGSRYMPSVLYSMRAIQIQKEDNLASKEIIKKAKVQLWNDDITDLGGELESGTFTLDDDNNIIPTN